MIIPQDRFKKLIICLYAIKKGYIIPKLGGIDTIACLDIHYANDAIEFHRNNPEFYAAVELIYDLFA